MRATINSTQINRDNYYVNQSSLMNVVEGILERCESSHEVESLLVQASVNEINNAFEFILRSEFPLDTKAPLLQQFLGHLSASDELFLVQHHPQIIQAMDSEATLKYAMESRSEKLLTVLAKHLPGSLQPKLIDFCWDQNFSKPLKTLCERGQSAKELVNRTLLPHLNQGSLKPKLESLLSVIPYLEDTNLSLILDDLVAREDFELTYELFEKSADLLTQLLKFKMTQPQLSFLFIFFWHNPEHIHNEQLQDLSNDLTESAPTFISIFINAEINHTASIFSPALAEIIDFLDLPTYERIFSILDHLLSRPTLSETELDTLENFVNHASRFSLMAWKYRYPAEEREYALLSKGTQRGKDGPVDVREAKITAQFLAEYAPQTVNFNSNNVANYLEGGTCTAMTMHFLRNYLIAKENGLTTRQAIQSIAPKFATSGFNFRTKQAAYNTIERRSPSPHDVFQKDKIEALLNWENSNLTITRASKLININENCIDLINHVYNSAPEGEHIVRALCPNYTNSKEEAYGHTTLLIKGEEGVYYYDPAVGILELNHPTQLRMVLEWQNARWSIPAVRFYTVDLEEGQ